MGDGLILDAQGLLEGFDGAAEVAMKVPWDDHMNGHIEVAGAAAVDAGESFAAKPED